MVRTPPSAMSVHFKTARLPETVLPYEPLVFYLHSAYFREKAPRELPLYPVPWQTTDKPPGSRWTHRSVGRGQIFTFLMPGFVDTNHEFLESRIYAPARLCHIVGGAVRNWPIF
eukprot:Gregarina_sp_Poly_1__2688@NODE_1739_length_3429_cov_82_111243_g1139_i0_p3_GENE_NODE_1739_length_3429_cov_82_111243_g1139_i0NODE_1739_length_3429_cov_82_111243_g1139_i0_p3_ORF_typecomplete_len114_score6_85_NODE_1739_length_3429_cov_82_111243_g1139_i019182259